MNNHQYGLSRRTSTPCVYHLYTRVDQQTGRGLSSGQADLKERTGKSVTPGRALQIREAPLPDLELAPPGCESDRIQESSTQERRNLN